ncbi:uncharacterized protein LOC131599196 isoform X2 [Vicia villosa]|uniref:uncharacterized protein LOC131599196 isoform X2 n=1 Tax=Vicia villosa TaxID=3911 RepID=UPI00273CD69A|nr:uncharacterized protein LOC131599196 isoform X2 [Vicia villosa]
MAQTTLIGRTRSEVTVLGATETLGSQGQLLQKLYAELDEEREASATAAIEAMDMILRLQGEKAMVEMEASQFKRMTEEMIDHAEATFEAYEQLMYDKEMETASLKFQLQAYKNKLVSLGCDLNASEFQYVHPNTSDQSSIKVMRRLKSFPSTPIKKTVTLSESNAHKTESPAPVSTDQEPSLVCASGTINSYWNKIKMLHAQAGLISDCNNIGENLKSRGGRSCSTLSKVCECGQTHRMNSANSTEVVNRCQLAHDSKTLTSRPCSTNAHDLFQVPEATVKHEVRRRHEKWNSLADIILTKPKSVSEGMIESPFKHDADKQKGTVTIVGQQKERMGVDCNSQAEIHQKIARLQRQKTSRRYQEVTSGFELGDNEEQLRLLREIKSELKLIQSEMRSLKTKNNTPVDDAVAFGFLQEAMVHFWI